MVLVLYVGTIFVRYVGMILVHTNTRSMFTYHANMTRITTFAYTPTVTGRYPSPIM